MIHKWYRGHDGKQKATDNFGIIWITDDPEYAQLYADEYGNDGVVSVLYIDESKLNYADTYYDDDFDVWFPDMAKVKEYQKEGYNCYSFPVSVDGLDCDCVALFDESAIVKIEQMNKNKSIMENRIKLTETELKGIIAESVKQVIKTLNESEVDNSYKPVGGGHKFTDKNGTKWTSVMTIKAPSGQMCHFVEDDHCYLLFNDDGEGKNCSDIKWIFPEAFETLKSLPPL